MICCPGLDYCSLALAGSIGVAQEINDSLDSIDYVHDLGEIKINISGCMNGCAHLLKQQLHQAAHQNSPLVGYQVLSTH
jgi:sulfite reductase beta subunit-like hemoprotein